MAFKFNVPTLEDLEKEEADVPPVVFIPKKPKLTDSNDSPVNPTPLVQKSNTTPLVTSNPSPPPPAPTTGFVRASSLPPPPSASANPPNQTITDKRPPIASPSVPKYAGIKAPSTPTWKPAQTVLTINERQRANPMIKYIKNVRYEFNAHINADFVMTANSCAVFLSIQYHMLHPEYIGKRVADLPPKFGLRVLLVLVDTEQHGDSILQLNKFAIDKKLTLILTWSNREAAQYIEAYNSFENKSADALKERTKDDLFSQAVDCFTQIRHISAPNVVSLLQHFGSVKNIISASLEQLSMIPGLGEKKVKRLHDTFNRPFNSALQQQRRAAQTVSSSTTTTTQAAPPAAGPPKPTNPDEDNTYSVRISDL